MVGGLGGGCTCEREQAGREGDGTSETWGQGGQGWKGSEQAASDVIGTAGCWLAAAHQGLPPPPPRCRCPQLPPPGDRRPRP